MNILDTFQVLTEIIPKFPTIPKRPNDGFVTKSGTLSSKYIHLNEIISSKSIKKRFIITGFKNIYTIILFDNWSRLCNNAHCVGPELILHD